MRGRTVSHECRIICTGYTECTQKLSDSHARKYGIAPNTVALAGSATRCLPRGCWPKFSVQKTGDGTLFSHLHPQADSNTTSHAAARGTARPFWLPCSDRRVKISCRHDNHETINFKRRVDVPQRFRHAAKPTWSEIPSVDHAARWQHPIVSSWSLRGQDFLVDGLMYLFLQSGVRCAYATKKIAWRCTMAMRKCRQLAHSTTGSAARGTSRKREKERFLSTKGGSQNTPY